MSDFRANPDCRLCGGTGYATWWEDGTPITEEFAPCPLCALEARVKELEAKKAHAEDAEGKLTKLGEAYLVLQGENDKRYFAQTKAEAELAAEREHLLEHGCHPNASESCKRAAGRESGRPKG